jgi:hypothetical protein
MRNCQSWKPLSSKPLSWKLPTKCLELETTTTRWKLETTTERRKLETASSTAHPSPKFKLQAFSRNTSSKPSVGGFKLNGFQLNGFELGPLPSKLANQFTP